MGIRVNRVSNAGRIIRTQLTDFGFDLASTVIRTLPIMGSVITNELGATVNTTTHEITNIPRGRYNVWAALSWFESIVSNTQRDVISLHLEVNGVKTGPNFNNNYVRDAGLNNTRSGQMLDMPSVDLVPTDVIRIRVDQLSGIGGVLTADAGGAQHQFVLTQTR